MDERSILSLVIPKIAVTTVPDCIMLAIPIKGVIYLSLLLRAKSTLMERSLLWTFASATEVRTARGQGPYDLDMDGLKLKALTWLSLVVGLDLVVLSLLSF